MIVKEINEKIFEYADKNPESKGLGTTLVIAIKTDDYILYGKCLNKTLSTRRSIDNLLNNSSKEELQVFYRMLSILKSQYVLKTEIEENKNEEDNKKAQ